MQVSNELKAPSQSSLTRDGGAAESPKESTCLKDRDDIRRDCSDEVFVDRAIGISHEMRLKLCLRDDTPCNTSTRNSLAVDSLFESEENVRVISEEYNAPVRDECKNYTNV